MTSTTTKIIFFIAGFATGVGASYAITKLYFEKAYEKAADERIYEDSKKAVSKVVDAANKYYLEEAAKKLKIIGDRDEQSKELNKKSQEEFDNWRSRIEDLEAREDRCREILGEEYVEQDDSENISLDDEKCLEMTLNGGLTNDEYDRVIELGTARELISEEDFASKMYPSYEYFEADYLADNQWYNFAAHEVLYTEENRWLEGADEYFHGGDIHSVYYADHAQNACVHIEWNEYSYNNLCEKGYV